MDLEEILRICAEYNKLGWAVQEQLDDLLNGETEQNPNAVKMMAKFAKALPPNARGELEEMIHEFTKANAA
jgi:hypothetical protein